MKKYFLAANTAEGYVDFFDEAAAGLSLVYTLSGQNANVSDTIKRAAYENNADEIILNPMDVNSVYGCIWRNEKTGLFCENTQKTELDTKNHKGLCKAYGEAKKIHDEWEKIYISNMNIETLERYCDGLLEQILGANFRNRPAANVNRFFGASTPSGTVNFIDELTDDLDTRYFIKGRPGTGKSTFLKKLGNAARAKGFDTETYYCSFDPKSLDMIIIRELSLCVFDSTAPHEKFPESGRDVILDFYKEAGLCGIDEKYAAELKDIAGRYNAKIREGREYLGKIAESM